MSAEPGFRRPPTAQEAVLDQLRRDIAAGDPAAGAQVVQESLAARYGVSRVPLREALKVLEAEGTVTYQPHRGYFVTELSLDDLLEVYRIRSLLEDEAVRVAVPLLTDDDVDHLADAVQDCEAAAAGGDVVAMAAANRRLHFGLFDASGLDRLVRLVRVLWDATDAYRAVYYGDGPSRTQVLAEHRAVLAALRRRDAGEAVRLLGEHRDHAVAHVRALLT